MGKRLLVTALLAALSLACNEKTTSTPDAQTEDVTDTSGIADLDAALDTTAPRCGDGTVDPGEVCDDGDQVDNGEGGCLADCSGHQVCGDGQTQGSEACDDGDPVDNGEGACVADCTAVQTCGNAVREGTESCDDGNTLDDPDGGCRADCSGPLGCGDGIVSPGEACDDGDTVDNGEGGCLADCSALQVCGDGVTQGTEVCDDGDTVDNGEGGCVADCSAVQRCGDDVQNGTEACDDGDAISNGEGRCIRDCSAIQTCGDGIRNGLEACDDGDTVDSGEGGCVADCMAVQTCGDRRVQGTEVCDDGDTIDNGEGRCVADCSAVQVCGDGVARGTEVCDDGDRVSNGEGACVADCSAVQRCGDGVVRGTEACDDGDTLSNGEDACVADCSAVQVCGDGTPQGTEACDDGDLVNNGEASCVADCSAWQACGDGVLQGTETCDDGDAVSNGEGACVADCSGVQTCGNATLEGTEACDDGYTDACGTCSADCTDVGTGSQCNDGIVCPETEECDNGSANSDGTPDACRTTCVAAYCSDGVLDTAEECDDGNTIDVDGCTGACIIDVTEGNGQATCATCHATILAAMDGTSPRTSRHALGAAATDFTDSGLGWTSPLSTHAAAVRSCVNMCHQDHAHNAPGGSDHGFNAHLDATTASSRAVSRNSGGEVVAGTPARTDFEAGGGLCVSCHRYPIGSGRRVIDGNAFSAAAHNFTGQCSTTWLPCASDADCGSGTCVAWTYDMHDGTGVFIRNCTKCHAGDGTATTYANADLATVHASDFKSLLFGSKNPADATTTPASTPQNFVCYQCHGNASVGQRRAPDDIATQIAKVATGSGHPVNSDAVHDTTLEWNDATFGNQLGGQSRHVNCLDCHDQHAARAGQRAVGSAANGNAAGPALHGAWGVALTTPPAFWAVTTAAAFTKKQLQAGVDAEATLCFKCHSDYWGALPTSPSGGYAQTDTAREFNPNNAGSGNRLGSFHPVLASAANNRGATDNIKAPWTRDSLMTCTDCHASEGNGEPAGPHGAAGKFVLKGPNTLWDETLTITASGMPDGTFCINCHNQDFTGSRYAPGNDPTAGHMRQPHVGLPCFNCHTAIPHGSARPGLLVSPRSQSVGGLEPTDAAPYLRLPTGFNGVQIDSYPTNNAQSWNRNNCACGNNNWMH